MHREAFAMMVLLIGAMFTEGKKLVAVVNQIIIQRYTKFVAQFPHFIIETYVILGRADAAGGIAPGKHDGKGIGFEGCCEQYAFVEIALKIPLRRKVINADKLRRTAQ